MARYERDGNQAGARSRALTPAAERCRCTAQGGFSLLYVVISIPVIAVALLGMSVVVEGTSRHPSQAEATTAAAAVLREKIAEIQNLANKDMAAVYATFTDKANRRFLVPEIAGVRAGLQPLPGNDYVGEVLCWSDETGASLPEGAVTGDSERLRLPLDLNMDDDAADANLLPLDMKVVPVKITLDFVDTSGPRHVEVFYLVASQPQ